MSSWKPNKENGNQCALPVIFTLGAGWWSEALSLFTESVDCQSLCYFSQEIIHMLWVDSNCSHIAKYWKSLSGGILMCVSSANSLVLSKASSKQALFSSPCFPDEPR